MDPNLDTASLAARVGPRVDEGPASRTRPAHKHEQLEPTRKHSSRRQPLRSASSFMVINKNNNNNNNTSNRQPRHSNPTTSLFHHHFTTFTKRQQSSLLSTSRTGNFIKYNYITIICLLIINNNYNNNNNLVHAADLEATLKNFTLIGSNNNQIVDIPRFTETIKILINNQPVNPGDRVPAKNFKDFKNDRISWSVGSLDARHTLLMLDLDRRSAGSNLTQVYNQFTSFNIPGSEINAGQTVVAFEPPIVQCTPPSKHRILMLALLQPQNIDLVDVVNIAASSGKSKNRENFDLKSLVRSHQLTVVAANAFYALGDVNGICSGASALSVGSVALLVSPLVALLITARALNRHC